MIRFNDMFTYIPDFLNSAYGLGNSGQNIWSISRGFFLLLLLFFVVWFRGGESGDKISDYFFNEVLGLMYVMTIFFFFFSFLFIHFGKVCVRFFFFCIFLYIQFATS